VQLLPFTSDDNYTTLETILELDSGRVVDLLVWETPEGVGVYSETALDDSEQDEVARKASWMLALEQDFSSFYALAANEPKLSQAVTQAHGRILRCPTLFEDIVKTITTTNTTWSGTKRMVQALVETFGAAHPSDPSWHAFPTPERLAAADVDALRRECKLGYRAPYVLELAKQVAAGEMDVESLKAGILSTLELRKKLLSIKGVGDYAAANLLMILGRYDYIPVDSWALNMVSKEFYNGEPITRKDVEVIFAPWGEWQGLAFWLWDRTD
jgi:3-methyladenine DNA glycosylase/8-oxoguanine DNA glycosylase